MFDKNDMRLLGLRFTDKQGVVLLATKWMQPQYYSQREKFGHLGFKEIPLGDGEKFLGIRCVTNDKKRAAMYEFQFVIGRLPKESELRPPPPKKSCIQIIREKLD